MASWSVGVPLRGKNGLSVLAGNGAPSPLLGEVGQPGFLSIDLSRLYGPKTDQGWPTTYVDLKASPATLPNNLTANSIILAPVQGETLATQITLKNASGTTVFAVDANGALNAASASLGSLVTSGAATVGGSLGVTGNASASRFVASTPGSSTSPMLAFTASGTGTAYTCGLYSDNLKSEIYEMVADRTARSITFVGTTPGNSDRAFFTHNLFSGTTGTQPAHRLYVGGGQLALQILGSADATFYGQLAVNALTTTAGLKLSSGALTFADGTTQTTAGGAAATPATYAATATGTAASPAFRYGSANNGAGVYFDGAQGNTLVSVNGYKSLYSTSAANAASGASGWAIASAYGAGSLLLALFGGGSATVPVASIDGVGALVAGAATFGGLAKAAGVTLTSGAVTFADGTTQSTAATASSGTGAGSGSTGSTTVHGLMPQWGPAAYLNGVTVTAGTDQKGYLPGTTTISSFTPQQDSALLGLQVNNYAATGATLTVGLLNTTTGQTVMTLAVGSGSRTGPAYATTAYPLVAGNQYVWYVSRAGGGIAYVTITPQYLAPTTSVVGASSFPKFVTASPTALSNAGVVLQPETFAPPQQGNFLSGKTAYLRSFTATLKGQGQASFVLSDGQVVLFTSVLMTATAAGNTMTFGPFTSGSPIGIPMQGGNNHYWYTMGTGGSCTAELQMTIVQ